MEGSPGTPAIHPITDGEFDRLGVDGANQLYWDGKPVRTKERLELAWAVNAAIVVGALSTLAFAVMQAISLLSGK